MFSPIKNSLSLSYGLLRLLPEHATDQWTLLDAQAGDHCPLITQHGNQYQREQARALDPGCTTRTPNALVWNTRRSFHSPIPNVMVCAPY